MSAQQPGLVRGSVLDAGTGEPIRAAALTLVGPGGQPGATSETDIRGRFGLPVPRPGTYRVRAEELGYERAETGDLRVSAGDTVAVELRLTPSPLLLESILVSVRRAGRSLRAGQQLVYGRLLDDSTHRPIGGGTLRLLTRSGDVAAQTLSDDRGHFWLVSPRPGAYRVQGARIGYRTAESKELELMLGDSIGLDFYLSTQAVLLEPITVTASARPWADRADVTGMEEFFERYDRYAKPGFGTFMTRDQIAEWEGRTSSVGMMLLANVAEVRGVSPGGEVIMRGGRFSGGVLQEKCIPLYYVDGAQVPYYVAEPLMPADLEAVEVYTSPNVPLELDHGRFPCGVVVYWTRRSPIRQSGGSL